MKLKIYFLYFFELLLAFSCNQKADNQAQTVEPPNFILFITDDISYNDLGCYGNEFARTPNIDKMAEEGILFTNAYVTTSSCSPSRCSIITSRYPHNTGAPELHVDLPENQVMFPQLMKEAGYYTVLSGKNHIGPVTENAFDTIDGGGGPGGEQHWLDHIRNRPAGKPFFFWLASHDAHRQWQIDSTAPVFKPEDVWVPPMLFDGPQTRQDLANYYHEVSRTDYYLGKIMEVLEEEGIADNTYIIYMSDNGRPFPRAKTRCYDSGMKTPFIVWNKRALKPGKSESLVSSIDIAPTIFELAGIDVSDRFQGVSFAKVLEDPASQSRELLFAEHNWHVFQSHERMLRVGEFMYIRNAFNEKMNMSVESAPVFPAGVELWQAYKEGSTNPKQEDIFMVPRPKEELYQVVNDPFQFNNLTGKEEYREKLNECRKIFDQWVTATGDNVPENPTPDRDDMYRNRLPGFKMGEMSGEKYGADTITNKGPWLMEHID